MKGPETAKAEPRRIKEGFFDKYMPGKGLDIGHKTGKGHCDAVLPTAEGIDLDYPGYNGLYLPFDSNTQDYVYASHTLEHIGNWYVAINEWFRVLKEGGHLIITVPHQYLYEKKWDLPSRWGAPHFRFYTPSSLLAEIEQALLPNSYRVKYLCDNDTEYDYNLPPEKHPVGEYQIECVIQKIKKPNWDVV